MKKLMLSLSTIFLFGIYSFFQRKDPSGGNIPTLAVTPSPNSESFMTKPNSVTSGIYKDGTYLGNVADAFYGNIQVQTAVKSGKIADVIFMQYPNDRSRSIAINTEAMPYLKSEAIQAQNANVDIISGATNTSLAFMESLASALNQAR